MGLWHAGLHPGPRKYQGLLYQGQQKHHGLNMWILRLFEGQKCKSPWKCAYGLGR